MSLDTGTHVLYGDWRRRRGTKTDAHLYRPGTSPIDAQLMLPACLKRVQRGLTVRVEKGRPCTDCLVAELTKR